MVSLYAAKMLCELLYDCTLKMRTTFALVKAEAFIKSDLHIDKKWFAQQ